MKDDTNWAEDEIIEEAKLLDRINQESSQIASSNKELENRLQDNAKMLRALTEKMIAFKQTSLGKREERIAVLSRKITELEEQNKAKVVLLEQKDESLAKQAKAIADLKENLVNRDRAEAAAHDRLKSSEQQNLQKQKEILALREELNALSSHHGKRSEETERLVKLLRDKDAQITMLEQNLAPLRKEKGSHENLAIVLREKDTSINAANAEIAHLKRQLKSTEEKHNKAITHHKMTTEEKLKAAIQESNKELLRLSDQVERQKQIIKQQRELLAQKQRRERALAQEIMGKFSNLLTPDEPRRHTMPKDHLAAMVQAAMEHSSDKKEIVNSLVNAGFKKEEIEKYLK